LAWAVDLGVEITDVERSLYIGSFCHFYINNERPTEKKHRNVGWDDVGK
jgi:hypothetical protein